MKKLSIVAGFCFLLFFQNAFAQDFIYTPKNPAFGGNSYNYSWMLNSAEVQNTYEAPVDDSNAGDNSESSTLDNFAESLNQQILSRLSQELIINQFGEDALEEGTYVLGDYQIEIGNSDTGIGVTIIDNVTGATTTVEVPYF